MHLRAWLKASRLASQSYLALPLLLGQAMAHAATGQFDPVVLVLVQLFGLFDQLYIVYANDYADRETDALNETPTIFSGGSRVLPEGLISPAALRAASILAALAALGVSAALGVFFGRWWPLPLAAAALALLWAYSYPPLKLSYRGGGELLQAVGVGVVLPLYGHTAQGAALEAFSWPVLWILLPAQLACALATTLPDVPSDRASDKRTAAVIFGPLPASGLIVVLGALCTTLLGVVPWGPSPGWWLLVPAVLVAGQLPVMGAAAGTARISLRVALAIAVTLAVDLLLIWGHLP